MVINSLCPLWSKYIDKTANQYNGFRLVTYRSQYLFRRTILTSVLPLRLWFVTYIALKVCTYKDTSVLKLSLTPHTQYLNLSSRNKNIVRVKIQSGTCSYKASHAVICHCPHTVLIRWRSQGRLAIFQRGGT